MQLLRGVSLERSPLFAEFRFGLWGNASTRSFGRGKASPPVGLAHDRADQRADQKGQRDCRADRDGVGVGQPVEELHPCLPNQLEYPLLIRHDMIPRFGETSLIGKVVLHHLHQSGAAEV